MLRGGLVCTAGGKVVSPRGPRQDCLLGQPFKAGSALEADHGAPMPGHLTQGGDTRQGSRLRGVPDQLLTCTDFWVQTLVRRH